MQPAEGPAGFPREQSGSVGERRTPAVPTHQLPLWPRRPTYREAAESIDWRRPFLQLRRSVGHDIFKERFHGWLMEWLLLRWRRLLLHQQVWIKLTRLLHHLLLHTKRSALKMTNGWGELWRGLYRLPSTFSFPSLCAGRGGPCAAVSTTRQTAQLTGLLKALPGSSKWRGGEEAGSQQKGEAQAYLLVRRLTAPRRHASLTLRPLLLR